MMAAAEKYDMAFNALGDRTRRAIFEKLQNGPLSVVHIAEGMAVSRPAVSQHLRVLKEAKLINITRQGTRSICELNQEGIFAIRDYLDQFWDRALAAFKASAENEEKLKKDDTKH
jgi:DNA-binding transcriptional ArsR family regulator